MKYASSFLSLFLLLTLSGCEGEETITLPPPSVGVMTVESRDVPFSDTYHGQTVGSLSVDIRAQVSGILVSRDYEEGALVKEGQLLFKIEPDKYRAALKQAQGTVQQVQARYRQAKRDLDRARKLYEKNAVSQRDRDVAVASYDTAKADLFSAQAALDAAQINYDHSFIRSPVTGYAGKERHSVGNLIDAMSGPDGLLTVVNKVDPIFVNFSLPSPVYMRMRTLWDQGRLEMKNVKAHIRLADGSNYPEEGEVIFLDTAVNPSTSVVSARASFPNPRLFVLPGQFVRLTTTGIILKDAMMIPQQAILQTQDGTLVAVVDGEGKAQMRKITLNSFSMGEWFLVDKGLSAGDRLIVDGMNRSIPGQPVNIDPDLTKKVAERFVLPRIEVKNGKE